MAITLVSNAKANVKQKSAADLASNSGLPVINQYIAESTAAQTSISLPFICDSTSPQSVQVFVDGRLLANGSTYDWTFSQIDGNLGSSVISLNASLSAGLNIIVNKLGIKKEVEGLTDARFTQLYSGMDAGFQGFVDESSKLTAVNGTPSAGQFRTFGIVGRASIPDLANDLRARMGVDRITVQQISELQNEFGPNGERVFKALNDDRDLIRFVGTGNSFVDTTGQYVGISNQNDYLEIVFYGTGLNALHTAMSSSGRDIRATVDGGSETSNLLPVSSSVIAARNYNSNTVLNIASGLTLGIHTVKIRNNQAGAAGAFFYGFEILNESSLVKVQPGTAYTQGKKITSSAQSAVTYNSGTYDSIKRDGATVTSLSTRGNRTLTYIKSDGTIGKSAIEVNSAQGNLGSADHTNEEVARRHHFREFGAGRTADDFSSSTATSMAFTLDDGTTTLMGNLNGIYQSFDNTLSTINTNGFTTFTFVGTGLDIIRRDSANATLDPHTFSIDGVTVGTISSGAACVTTPTQFKVVSGLPYGTHTFKVLRTASALNGFGMLGFVVYQPKKPTLPAGAVELADYNVMADFVANTTASTVNIATGTLRKANAREFVYVNGTGGTQDWNISAPDVNYMAVNVLTDRTGSYLEYTFFGTGFEYRFRSDTSRSTNITVALNGTTLTSTNFPTASFSIYGASTGSFTAATGQLNISGAAQSGAGFRVSGLPLNKYTIRFTNNVASSVFLVDALDIITPIHSPKSNFQADLQNTLPVGSCGISDNRRLSPVKSEDPKKFRGAARSIGALVTTTSTTYVPFADIPAGITAICNKAAGAWFRISFNMSVYNTGAALTKAQIYVDGQAVSVEFTVSGGSYSPLNGTQLVFLPAGAHKVDIYWKASGSTSSNDTLNASSMMVEEI